MLKNKLYLYGDEANGKIPAHLHVGKLLLNKFKSFGDHVAIINAETDERITFKEMTQQIVDVALSLAHIGAKKGDVVSICSGNILEFLPIVYATIAAGATFSAIDPSCAGVAFLHRFNIARPKYLFCSPSAYHKHKEAIKSVDFIEKIIILGESDEGTVGFDEFLTQQANVDDFEAAPINPFEDSALILYSTGTTGLPKGIKVTHLNMLIMTLEWTAKEDKKGKLLVLFDWHYSFGLCMSIYAHISGLTNIYHNNVNEQKILEIVQQYKISKIPITPTGLYALVKMRNISEYDTSSVKAVFVTGTSCDESLLQAVKQSMPSVLVAMQHYGMTEVGPICHSLNAPLGPRPGSVGLIRNMAVLKVVDVETREPLGANQRGEICFKSPSIMKDYIGAKYDYLDEEGFFKTGDIGYYDEDKYVYVVDRIKDLIKFNTYHVSPAELEMVLQHHPAVFEAGVVGAPHEECGELPTGFVVLRPGATATVEELVEFVGKHMPTRARLAGGVRFLDELPRCGGMKLDRKKLRLML